ncbi:helix-turn-helix domain-containing protein [Candidatus Poribacteria bacterium]
MDRENSFADSAIDNPGAKHYYTNAKPGLEGLNSADLSNRLLTTQEVCELLKISKGYLYWLTHQKKIPHIKMMGHLRFRESAIDNWLRAQEVRSGGT